MNIWSKMITALRGGVNEAGEAIVDSQALRILDQEVRDAGLELTDAKKGLAEIMAKQKLSDERVSGLRNKISEHEEYVRQALEKEESALAREVAEKIVVLETAIVDEQSVADEYAKSADQLRQSIATTESNLKRLKQQVDTVKATESVHRAQAAVAERFSGADSKLRTAMDSLERIKEKQALNAAKMQAATEVAEATSDASLMDKLAAAGITKNEKKVDDILERLKKS